MLLSASSNPFFPAVTKQPKHFAQEWWRWSCGNLTVSFKQIDEWKQTNRWMDFQNCKSIKKISAGCSSSLDMPYESWTIFPFSANARNHFHSVSLFNAPSMPSSLNQRWVWWWRPFFKGCYQMGLWALICANTTSHTVCTWSIWDQSRTWLSSSSACQTRFLSWGGQGEEKKKRRIGASWELLESFLVIDFVASK